MEDRKIDFDLVGSDAEKQAGKTRAKGGKGKAFQKGARNGGAGESRKQGKKPRKPKKGKPGSAWTLSDEPFRMSHTRWARFLSTASRIVWASGCANPKKIVPIAANMIVFFIFV